MSAKSLGRSGVSVLGLTVWVVFAFIGAQIVAGIVFALISGAFPVLQSFSDAVQVIMLQSVSYVLAFCLIAFVPLPFGKKRPLWQTFGALRWPSWSDIGFSLLAVLPYLLLSAILLGIFSSIIPSIKTSDTQELPFENLVFQYEYLAAFIGLVILAPIAEELFFRGYFMTKLMDKTNKWFALVFSAVIFGLLHSIGAGEAGFTTQWQAAIDVTALGLVLAGLRLLTNNIWAGVILHMLKNGIAYAVLFILPALSGTM